MRCAVCGVRRAVRGVWFAACWVGCFKISSREGIGMGLYIIEFLTVYLEDQDS